MCYMHTGENKAEMYETCFERNAGDFEGLSFDYNKASI